ncbi:hypothetical protein TRFO_01273 [Tritrichomonas foetus]|uniref:Uncharacterized protein n=1 Tax=Tritrichomonas foetus TaxID=1144522 RepID=A0A1J4K6R1_9EUKA|nr:hypothetical protein TRFO_01273 [Tritrichomonas foetus]|eukprot:OHT07153.1 hypothetical protein TRFO_01273 [Tritrichomonas foetus]
MNYANVKNHQFLFFSLPFFLKKHEKMSVLPTPKSPLSPVRPHVHGEDKKQDDLDKKTVQAVAEAGGPNHIQAEYFNLICKSVLGSENEKFKELQPKLDIPDYEYYSRAVKLVLAYLLRHRMTYTVSCIRHEYGKCPKQTGFNKPSEVDSYIKELIGPLGSRSTTRSTTRSTSRASSVSDGRDINTVPVTPKV